MRERRQPRHPRIVRAGQPVAKPAPRVEPPVKKTTAKKTTKRAAKKNSAAPEPAPEVPETPEVLPVSEDDSTEEPES